MHACAGAATVWQASAGATSRSTNRGIMSACYCTHVVLVDVTAAQPGPPTCAVLCCDEGSPTWSSRKPYQTATRLQSTTARHGHDTGQGGQHLVVHGGPPLHVGRSAAVPPPRRCRSQHPSPPPLTPAACQGPGGPPHATPSRHLPRHRRPPRPHPPRRRPRVPAATRLLLLVPRPAPLSFCAHAAASARRAGSPDSAAAAKTCGHRCSPTARRPYPPAATRRGRPRCQALPPPADHGCGHGRVYHGQDRSCCEPQRPLDRPPSPVHA